MADGSRETGSPITAQAVRREVRDFLRSHEQRRRQIPRSLVIGLLTGLIAVAFRGVLREADAFRDRLVETAHSHPTWGVLLVLLFSAAGAGAAVVLVRRLAPETSGSGIPHVKAVLNGASPMRWMHVLSVKFSGGVAGIGAGLALGREGPTIQMGAAVGQMVSTWFPSTPRERRTLVAAGAGAGLAAAFNAPISGLIFVLEEVQRDFAPGVFTATLVASAVSDVVTRLLLGQLPVFHVTAQSIPPLNSLPISVALGFACGVLGVAFNRGLLRSLDLFGRIRETPALWTGGLVGAAVGAVALFAPGAVGGGDRLVVRTLAGEEPFLALLGFFVLRFVLTMASYGCGAPGGIFAPLLVLGSEIGLAVGGLSFRFLPRAVDHPETFAVVGMAAYFSAIVRAPLTGIVLIVEMTGNYSLVLPLMIACLTAYGVAELLRDRPVYEALLERDLLRSRESAALDDTLLLDLTVKPGAPFEDRRVRELGLPPGCIVILLRHGVREEVPTAESRIMAGDQMTVLVAPQAAHALRLLHEGAGLGL